jgi:hypothetical protein
MFVFSGTIFGLTYATVEGIDVPADELGGGQCSGEEGGEGATASLRDRVPWGSMVPVGTMLRDEPGARGACSPF